MELHPNRWPLGRLDGFRCHLLAAKKQRMPVREGKEIARLSLDAYLSRNLQGKVVLFDEHILHHYPSEIIKSIALEVDGFDSFLESRLLVLVVDDPKNIAHKVALRQKRTGKVWVGHQNRSDKEIVDFSKRAIAAGLEMHDLLVSRGFHSIVLNAQDDIDSLVERVVNYQG